MRKKKKKGSKRSRPSMRERAKQRAKERESQGGSTTLNLPEGLEKFKPKQGTTYFDIIPYRVAVKNHPEVEKGDLWYQRSYRIHPQVNGRSYVCPGSVGKACPICERRQELRKDRNADEDELKETYTKERELYNVMVHGEDGRELTIMDMSYHLFGKQLEEEIRNDEDDEIGGFAELEEGLTIKARWKNRKIQNKRGDDITFVEVNKIEFEEREEQYDEDVLDDVIDLDALLIVPTYEELEKAFNGLPDDDDEDDDDDDDEDDEEFDEDDAPFEDDEEEKPSRRKKSKSKKSSRKKKKTRSPKCPYGGDFGDDCDELDECDECELWSDCKDAQED